MPSNCDPAGTDFSGSGGHVPKKGVSDWPCCDGSTEELTEAGGPTSRCRWATGPGPDYAKMCPTEVSYGVGINGVPKAYGGKINAPKQAESQSYIDDWNYLENGEWYWDTWDPGFTWSWHTTTVLELRVNDDATVDVYKDGVLLDGVPDAVPEDGWKRTQCANGERSPYECDKWQGNGPPGWPGSKKLLFPAYFSVQIHAGHSAGCTTDCRVTAEWIVEDPPTCGVAANIGLEEDIDLGDCKPNDDGWANVDMDGIPGASTDADGNTQNQQISIAFKTKNVSKDENVCD